VSAEAPVRRPAKSSRERFERFHAENPHVYQLFKRFAFEAVRAHRGRFSARTILHRIRWYTRVETDDPEGFKINDHWSPYYSRLFVTDHPEHEDFFETRRAIADEKSPEPEGLPAWWGMENG
jgi:hypothetical protein